jgi:hypothetical protein
MSCGSDDSFNSSDIEDDVIIGLHSVYDETKPSTCFLDNPASEGKLFTNLFQFVSNFSVFFQFFFSFFLFFFFFFFF